MKGPVPILLVEDDDVDALSVERVFRKAGLPHAIHRVRDGLEALEALRSGTLPAPCLVLLDLNLPRMDGFEFLRLLRIDPRLKDTPVCMITTSRRDEDRGRACALGVVGFVVKTGAGRDLHDLAGLVEDYWEREVRP